MAAPLTIGKLSSQRLTNCVRKFSSKSYRYSGAVSSFENKNRNNLQREHYLLHSTRCMSAMPIIELSEREQKYFRMGWMDERGFTLFNTLHENQKRACEIFANNEFLGVYNKETEQFEYLTYAEVGEKVDKCRDFLKHLGIREFDKVGIISNNRWEWVTIASAAYSLNASIVPMYEAQLASDWSYITNDSGLNILFCATQDIYDRVQTDVVPNAPSLQSTICLDAPEGEPHAFATAMSNAGKDTEGSLILEPTPDDLASLIYTSGTTGRPKGVELTHDNLCTNAIAAARTMVEDPRSFVNESDRSLSFLPWAHSYGQTCELWIGMAHGSSSGICRGVPFILEDLQLVKPTILFAVPTLYKKVYDGVRNVIESSSKVKKGLMMTALELGRKKSEFRRGKGPALNFLESLQDRALDPIVLSKIRARFGGNIRHCFVAGAACPEEVMTFMDSVGIPVLEGYGLTETSPIIAINSTEQRSIGSVGRAIGGVTVHIMKDGKPVQDGEEGEICCVGPNVMKGYYNNPSATEEVISMAPDGKSRMFHTGDLGVRSMNGFIRVTGRIKELYKLENGKYVTPGPIEEAIEMSRFIGQVVLVGANRPYNVALIVPEWNAIRSEFNISDDVTDDELVNDERVRYLFDAEIEMSCYQTKKFETPKKWAIVAPFTVANDMLTPKMSIRKHKVVAVYSDLVNDLYKEIIDSDAKEKSAVAA